MGIRFHCPQGHKLNVKSFLAGKKGVCPKCGAKFRIPQTSEPGMTDSDVEETDPSAPEAKGGNGSPAVAVSSDEQVAAIAAVAQGASPSARLSTTTGGTAAATASAIQPAVVDPIAEAPAAVWYVRPPTGGQYGPARGEVMRKWISEGRVSSDSLVWREGWTDWRTAGDLFPSLRAAAAPVAAAASKPASPQAAQTATRYQAKQRSGNELAIIAVIGLSVLCVVLMAALAYLLLSQ